MEVEAKPKKPAPLSEHQLLALLRKKYAAPEYAFLTHVRNATGFGSVTRTADALAMSLFPSRGLYLTGFEVKSSRSDWMRELADPSKADEIARFCDAWVLVIGDREIVKPGELPPMWGLMAPAKRDGQLQTVFAAEIKKKELQQPISRRFLAAILRCAEGSSASNAEINSAVTDAKKLWEEEDERNHKHRTTLIERDLDGLRKQVAAFEKASGVSMNQWDDGHRIGEAVRALRNMGGNTRFDHVLNTARALVADIERRAEILREYEKSMTAPLDV